MMNVLPVGENRMIVASFVSTKHRNVTEDGQTDGRTASWHIQRWNSFQLFRRAVKSARGARGVYITDRRRQIVRWSGHQATQRIVLR